MEHTFRLAPLGSADGTAYDFSGAFNYTQRPLQPVAMTQQPISDAERAVLAAHPEDPDEPT